MTARTALACAALAGIVASLAANSPTGAFGVGVLRRDGIVIPFATFDGRRWRDAWPGPQAQVVVPISVAGIPKRWWGATGPLETWQAWIPDRGERSIHVTQPDWVNVHCARRLALRTDYQTPLVLPSEDEQPYPKDGIAVSPPQTIEPVHAVVPTAVELHPLGPVLLEAFNMAERETAAHANHPVARRAREIAEPQIEAAYAYGTSPRYYYIEATRIYRRLGQAAGECQAQAFATGWFIREGDRFRSLLTSVDLLPCTRFGASYMLPLSVIRAADRTFWLAQFSGGDHERYVVIELTPKKADLMVSTWGGGC